MNKTIFKDALRLALHLNDYFMEEVPAALAQACVLRSRGLKEALREFMQEEFASRPAEGKEKEKTKVKID